MTAGHASEKVSNTQNDVGARFDLLCAGEDGPVEARAQEGQPAPPDPAQTGQHRQVESTRT